MTTSSAGALAGTSRERSFSIFYTGNGRKKRRTKKILRGWSSVWVAVVLMMLIAAGGGFMVGVVYGMEHRE